MIIKASSLTINNCNRFMTLFNLMVYGSFLLLIGITLTGCKTAVAPQVEPLLTLHDQVFPGYAEIKIETEEEVFSLSPEMVEFVENELGGVTGSNKKIKALADAIFSHSAMNLLYQNDANTTAMQTFNNRAANCLSLTIMSYALADHAALGVSFQQVDTPDLWVRRGGDSLLNRHVNLRLFNKAEDNVVHYANRSFQLDFDRRAQSLYLPYKIINKKTVLGMFYSNKGADALIKKDYDRAYAYFRTALLTDPLLIEGWTNLGILYRRVGQNDYAEQTYNLALRINENDYTIWENLAYLYSITDRKEEAALISQRVDNKRQDNPYYHFMLGEIASENKNWHQSIDHYQKAIALNPHQHEFYFSAAQSYFHLKDYKRAQRYMKQAKRFSLRESEEQLYQGKINHLELLEKKQQPPSS